MNLTVYSMESMKKGIMGFLTLTLMLCLFPFAKGMKPHKSLQELLSEQRVMRGSVRLAPLQRAQNPLMVTLETIIEGNTAHKIAPEEAKKVLISMKQAGNRLDREDNYHGCFPLTRAVQTGNCELVQMLLAQGAHVDMQSIRIAIQRYTTDSPDMIDTLASSRSSLETILNATLSSESTNDEHNYFLQVLIERGANTTPIMSKLGIASVYHALLIGDETRAVILINNGVNVCTRVHTQQGEPLGQTLVHLAVLYSRVHVLHACFKQLHQLNIDLNSLTDIFGNRLLHYAQSEEIKRLLVEAGADITMENRYRETPDTVDRNSPWSPTADLERHGQLSPLDHDPNSQPPSSPVIGTRETSFVRGQSCFPRQASQKKTGLRLTDARKFSKNNEKNGAIL